VTAREEDIRTQIEAWLKQQGVSVEREVVCGNGVRADLVTPDTVIEVKKYLNRGALYQAHGQGAAYQKLLKKPKLLIIGLAPTTEAKYQEAQRIAENIRTDAVEVVFIDKDPKWAQATFAAVDPQPPRTQSTIKLPFEPVPAKADATAKGGKSSSNSASSKSSQVPAPASSNHLTFTSKDIWALLLIILLFLWIKAAVWKNQVEVEPPQSVPEFSSPPQNLPPQNSPSQNK
jgi:hypothetical protein